MRAWINISTVYQIDIKSETERERKRDRERRLDWSERRRKISPLICASFRVFQILISSDNRGIKMNDISRQRDGVEIFRITIGILIGLTSVQRLKMSKCENFRFEGKKREEKLFGALISSYTSAWHCFFITNGDAICIFPQDSLKVPLATQFWIVTQSLETTDAVTRARFLSAIRYRL